MLFFRIPDPNFHESKIIFRSGKLWRGKEDLAFQLLSLSPFFVSTYLASHWTKEKATSLPFPFSLFHSAALHSNQLSKFKF